MANNVIYVEPCNSYYKMDLLRNDRQEGSKNREQSITSGKMLNVFYPLYRLKNCILDSFFIPGSYLN